MISDKISKAPIAQSESLRDEIVAQTFFPSNSNQKANSPKACDLQRNMSAGVNTHKQSTQQLSLCSDNSDSKETETAQICEPLFVDNDSLRKSLSSPHSVTMESSSDINDTARQCKSLQNLSTEKSGKDVVDNPNDITSLVNDVNESHRFVKTESIRNCAHTHDPMSSSSGDICYASTNKLTGKSIINLYF